MDNQSKPRSPMSEIQRRKLMELYHSQHKGVTEQAVAEGLDLLFQSNFKHPMSAASYEEGAHITAILLNQQKAIGPSKPEPQPETQPAPVPSAPLAAPAIELTEAPFSWNVTAEAEDGWNEMFTVRALNSGEFINRVEGVKKYLASKNYKPATRGKAPAANAPAANAPAPDGSDWCEIHQAKMRLHQGNGESWYSHKAQDREGREYWCKGKPPKAKQN